MSFKPSAYQQALFDFVENGSGSALVNAVAGSGKTTSILKALSYIKSGRALFLAFNKSIVDELVEKAPSWVDVRTLNSLGHRAWMRSEGKVTLNQYKTRSILSDLIKDGKFFGESEIGITNFSDFKEHVSKLVSLAKGNGLVPVLFEYPEFESLRSVVPDDESFWAEIADDYELDFGYSELASEATLAEMAAMGLNNEEQFIKIGVRTARYVLARSILMKNEIDFDDQLYMPYIYRSRMDMYSWIMVDEVQDLNQIQRHLVGASLDPIDGRLIAVGDFRQCIYGFRGADHDSMQRMGEMFNCTLLPLSISYRCPKLVVEEAQKIVPNIEAWEAAEDGVVKRLHRMKVKDLKPGDFILSRFNAPVVSLCYRALREGKPVKIIGRDIGKTIIKFIEGFKARDLKELSEAISAWKDVELEKAARKNKQSKVTSIYDKYSVALAFIELVDEGGSVEDVIRTIQRIYAQATDTKSKDNSNFVTFSTIHRAKGMEADVVYFLDPDDVPCRFAKTEKQITQEWNLKYVAITRAKKVLNYISSSDFQ